MGSGRYVCSCGYARRVSWTDIEAIERQGCPGCGRTGNVYAQCNAAALVRDRRGRFMRKVVVVVVLVVAGWLVYEPVLQQNGAVDQQEKGAVVGQR